MSKPPSTSLTSLIALVVFAAFFAVFTARGLLPADSGEFQVVVPLLGVAHPPGFPLYTLLGKLFVSLVPISTPAYRLNLLSAALAALTLVFVLQAVRTLTGSLAAGLLAALALGVSTTFWSQATTANVRMLTALCAAAALSQAARLRAQVTRGKTQGARNESQLPKPNPQSLLANPLVLFFLALGLGISHHASLAFMGAVFAAYVGLLLVEGLPGGQRKAESGKWRLAIACAAAFGAPFLFNIYLWARGAAGAFLAPPRLATGPGFLEHVLARGFEGDFFYFANWQALPDRLAILGNILTFQFNPVLLAGMAFGGLAALRRDWRLFGLLAGSFAVHSFVAVTYRAPQTVEYMLPAYVLLAVALGYGLGALLPNTQHATRNSDSVLRVAYCVFLLAACLSLALRNLPSYLRLARDEPARAYAEAVLAAAPPGALVLSAWHWATPLWYLQKIEGQRPDVEVAYVFPQGESLALNWVERIAAESALRPVVVTGYYPAEYGAAGYRLAPLGPAWLVLPGPAAGPPDALTPSDTLFGERWRLAGHRLENSEARPGETLAVVAAWVAPPDPEDIHFFVQLIGPDGALYGQMDVTQLADRTAPGEWLASRYLLAVRPDTAPGDYALVAGAYLNDGRRLTVGANGPDNARLGTVRVGLAQSPPPTRHPIVRPAWGTRLVGYDYDRSLPASTRLYLHWRLGPAAEHATVWQGSSPFAETALPAGPGYLTTTVDLPPEAVGVQVALGPPRVPGLFDWRAYRLPSASPDARYVPLGGALALAGARVTREAGGEVRVDLDWLSAGPLLEDDIVKVDWIGPDYAWRAESNSVPAGGAIPTLKWVAGSLVHDRHRLAPPPEAAPGPARLELAVYDHFTERVLPILDPRLALLGSTVPLGEVDLGR